MLPSAASFNRSLWRAVGSALGREGRALHNANLDAANFWAPDVNPFRDPRYGRGQETGGEVQQHKLCLEDTKNPLR